MERLGHAEYARLLDLIAELQEPVALPDFGKHLVRIAGELFPGMTVAFDQIEESTGYYAIDHNFPLSESEQARLFARLQEVYQQNPIYSYIQSGRRGTVVDIGDLMPRDRFHRTEFYQDIFRPTKLEHQVNVLLSREGWISVLTINGEKQIPGRMQTLLGLAARHIRLAHRNACLLDGAQVLKAPHAAPPSTLTPRECEVFEWLREGKRNAEIAMILGCAPRTVDKHVQNILRKTGAETRTAAARNGMTGF